MTTSRSGGLRGRRSAASGEDGTVGVGDAPAGPRAAVKPVLTVLLIASLVAGVFPVAAAWPPWADDDAVRHDAAVTVEWLMEHVGDADIRVVDVRSRALYEAGHLPGAVRIDAGSGTPGDAPGLFSRAGLSGAERIVVCGDDLLSPDAARAFWLAEYAGAGRAAVLEGGVRAWTAAGGELRTGTVHPEAAAWVTASRTDRLASTAYVALSFGLDGCEIVDARGGDAWAGTAGRPRTGHIPHSLPLAPDSFIVDGALLTPEASRAMLSRFGPRPSSPVDLSWQFIAYGGADGRGPVLYYLLRRAGLERVRLYAGGWERWVSDDALPVVRIIAPRELRERLARERRWFAPDSPPPGFAFFDVRHWSDYRRGHIPGAVNLTSRLFGDSLDIVLERHWPKLERTRDPIVTYCYGSDCIRSRRTSTVAARSGFLVIERFYEGLEGWRATGGPVATTESPEK